MDSTAVIATQIATLITVIIGFLVALYREQRNRRWDLEDRERARKESLVRQIESDVASRERHEGIGEKLTKIIQEQSNQHVTALPSKVEEVKTKVEQIEEITKETKDKVTDIKQKIDRE